MQVYLIRHPAPIEAEGLCYGREDLRVEPHALAAAATAVRGRIPAAVLGAAPVFTSPMSRCLELARELAMPREPLVCDDLVELDFGAWEGASWDAVPRDELNAWAADVWGYRPGGGESAAMAAGRWRTWSGALRHCAADAALAVTHAGIIRVALACTGELSGGSFASFPIPFGSVHRILLEESPDPAASVGA
ncbi:MAG: histidine phosphatase family protein [Steroidobacteraceae bacterium]|jgi:alpha-ribazole phosphatase